MIRELAHCLPRERQVELALLLDGQLDVSAMGSR
jgi:hypothetical protein